MNILKQLKWSAIILAVAYIVLGVVFFMFPSETRTVFSYILAIALIVFGIVNLIQYARLDQTALINSYDLVIGFSAIIGGILIIINIEKFSNLILIVFGFMVLVSGVVKLQSSVNLMRLRSGAWHIPFSLALLNIVFGVIMLINPFALDVFFILLGIAFIYCGITDIIVTVMVSVRIKHVTDLIMAPNANEGGNTAN
ncbi:MAG: DUF308 domain-containing protein [Eubacterium sp.]|nr:DUF308 domain-containing protein [Eubacterium sp.]